MITIKLCKTLKISFTGLILFFCVQLLAKENDDLSLTTIVENHAGKDTIKTSVIESGWVPTTSLYLELGGKFIPSLNVDFRKRENRAISIGISYWWDAEEHKQSLFFTVRYGLLLNR